MKESNWKSCDWRSW